MHVNMAVPKLSVLMAAVLLAMVLVVGWAEPALAQQSRLGFGTDIGVWTGTSDGTVFALGFNLDYYFDTAFSLGPMVLFAPSSDLTQVAFAPVARFHIQLDAVNIVPFAGFGFIHADLERQIGPFSSDPDDITYYIPLGIALEVPVSQNLAVSATVLVNLHGLDLPPVRFLPVRGDDDTSVALLFGMRFGR